jgi:isopentenyl-diphosphate delta-isomerase
MEKEYVILVDSNDHPLGKMEKLEAHQKGLLHRAFSVLIWNSKNEILIHQRAFGKYHSEGLWTNTCCSHPRPPETILEAAHRRLFEEMGFDCPLEQRFHFIYKTELENELIEHELDHILIGEFNEEPNPNPTEVNAYRWINLLDLKQEIATSPTHFTFWFKEIIAKFEEKITLEVLNLS